MMVNTSNHHGNPRLFKRLVELFAEANELAGEAIEASPLTYGIVAELLEADGLADTQSAVRVLGDIETDVNRFCESVMLHWIELRRLRALDQDTEGR